MFKPLYGFALVRPEKIAEKTTGGIYYTSRAIRDSFYGTVVEKADDITQFDVGDRVAIKTYSALKIDVGDDEFYVISEDEAFGIDRGRKYMQMLNDYVLIQQVESRMTPGGRIFLPDKKNIDNALDIATSDFGVVIAVGSGTIDDKGERIPPCVNVGDWVCIESPIRNGFEVTIDDKKYNVMREKNIIFKQVIEDE